MSLGGARRGTRNFLTSATSLPVVAMPHKLKDDMRALGGNDEDMDLLKDVDSDAELPPASSGKDDVRWRAAVHGHGTNASVPPQRALSSDLSKFMKGLDFGNSAKGKGKAVASADPPASANRADKVGGIHISMFEPYVYTLYRRK